MYERLTQKNVGNILVFKTKTQLRTLSEFGFPEQLMQRKKLYIPSSNALPLVSQPSCLLDEGLYELGHKCVSFQKVLLIKKQLCKGLNGTQQFKISDRPLPSCLVSLFNTSFAWVRNCGRIIFPLPYYSWQWLNCYNFQCCRVKPEIAAGPQHNYSRTTDKNPSSSILVMSF